MMIDLIFQSLNDSDMIFQARMMFCPNDTDIIIRKKKRGKYGRILWIKQMNITLKRSILSHKWDFHDFLKIRFIDIHFFFVF